MISFITDFSGVLLAFINSKIGIMLERGFLRNHPDNKRKHYQVASLISKLLLYLGAIILILSFGYLVINTDIADALVGMIFPFLVAGLGLIIVSQFVKRAYAKLRR